MQHSIAIMSHTAYTGSAQSRLNTLELTCSTVDPHRMSSIGCKLLAPSYINIKYSASTQSHLNLKFYLERPYRYHHTSRSNTVDQYHLDSILWKRSTQDEIHTWKCIFDEHGFKYQNTMDTLYCNSIWWIMHAT